MNLGERRQINPAKVKAAREECGLTKAAAADAAQLSRPAYNRWEDGRRGPLRTFDAFRLARLSERLGKSLNDLTDPMPLDLPADQALAAS